MPSALELLGSRVKELRLAQKLSQERLAELSGVHRNFPGMLERGGKPPGFDRLMRIAMGLKVRPAELFKNIPVPKPEDFPKPKKKKEK